jgi:hypothetical protein
MSFPLGRIVSEMRLWCPQICLELDFGLANESFLIYIIREDVNYKKFLSIYKEGT